MSEIILYATLEDAEIIRSWVNAQPEVAWIVKVGQRGLQYHWRAVSELEALQEQEYALWHVHSGPLNIPSGALQVPDAVVANPFHGWSQTLDSPNASKPWFGAGLPGPFTFALRSTGRERPGSIGRSGFTWHGDRFKSMGMPAHPEAKRWWSRLARFVASNATAVPWPGLAAGERGRAYVFPQACALARQGRHRDVNP